MGSMLLVLFIAVANLAIGVALAVATGAAPPLREIVDGIIYEPYEDQRSIATTPGDDGAKAESAG